MASRDLLMDTWVAVGTATARIDALVAGEVDRVAGVPMSTAEVLVQLLHEPSHDLPTTQLARCVSFSSGGFTKVVDRLEHDGLIARRDDPEDRRVVRVALTGRGEVLAKKVAAAMTRTLRAHLGGPLGDERLQALQETMLVLCQAPAGS